MDQLIEPLTQETKIEEYEILTCVGQGGFGTSYLCKDVNLTRRCVLKEYTPHHLACRGQNQCIHPLTLKYESIYSQGLSDFLSEARKLARFSHPNIVKIHRFIELQNTAYIVMEYEIGLTLREYAHNRNIKFEETELEAIILPLCLGLQNLHDNKLIHRDIKPENIIIRSNGEPVLIDFGAAIDYSESVNPVIATPHYAPPEQFSETATQGPYTDVYALCAVLYELISGELPIPALKRMELDQLNSAQNIGRGKYSDRLLTLIDNGLSLDPLERPQNLQEVISILTLDNNAIFKNIINDTSHKAIIHFLNWSKPNRNLYVDELVTFIVLFPVLDLSWRLGKGSPTKEIYRSIYNSFISDIVIFCESIMIDKGFNTYSRALSQSTIESRIEEYASAYMLDRQEEGWDYKLTTAQCAKNCLSKSATSDIAGFKDLIQDVIDRARGRVKRNYRKKFNRVNWRHTSEGWRKEIRSLNNA